VEGSEYESAPRLVAESGRRCWQPKTPDRFMQSAAAAAVAVAQYEGTLEGIGHGNRIATSAGMSTVSARSAT